MLQHKGTTQQPYTFLGQFGVQQENSTIYYVRARYYDSKNGRFFSKDYYPANLKNPQTLNRYVYGGNNPISRYDANGMNWFGDAWNNITSNWYSPIIAPLYKGTGEMYSTIGGLLDAGEPFKNTLTNMGSFFSKTGDVFENLNLINDAYNISKSVIRFAVDDFYNQVTVSEYVKDFSTVLITGTAIIVGTSTAVASLPLIPFLLVGAGIGVAAYGLDKGVDYLIDKYGTRMDKWNFNSHQSSSSNCGGGGAY